MIASHDFVSHGYESHAFETIGMETHCRAPIRASRFRFHRLGIFLAVWCGITATILTGQSSAQDGLVQDQSTTQDTPAAKKTEAQEAPKTDPRDLADPARKLQSDAIKNRAAEFGHWGVKGGVYSSWTNHSNRLIPVYTFGLDLSELRAAGSVYRSPERLAELYGHVPQDTVNPTAMYFDQTDVYQLQLAAVQAGCNNIILMVFDGMDWQTTRAAAIYKTGAVQYDSGRGRGLAFQDFRKAKTDFGLVCTSPWSGGVKGDVDSQTLANPGKASTGGFDVARGQDAPWHERVASDYLIGTNRVRPHAVTDSASSATSMTTGKKTYNGAINVGPGGEQWIPIARMLQAEQDFKIGVVTSVPVSHATPAAAYANNVSRKDYQDIARDLIGLPSASHRNDPLPGVDVLIGGGWGEGKKSDTAQGTNFMPGNPYMHQDDIRKSSLDQGGRYVVAQRTPGQSGREVLMHAAQKAADEDHRLLGYFGVQGGHLPFRTADGNFDPTFDMKGTEQYTPEDVSENPTLADMTEAALLVLEQSIDGFWLMIEAGDVDWANHANNIDNSIGAVLSGEAAFERVVYWIEENNAWDRTAVIVTADHGHYLVLDDPQKIADAAP